MTFFRREGENPMKHFGSYLTIAGTVPIDSHGDIQTLMDATACSRKFARTILKAVSEGTEDQLLTRNVRCDSIKATKWPDKIANFVFQPENTRAMFGK